MKKSDPKEALAAATKYLKADRWLKDGPSGIDARRATLARLAGRDVVEDSNGRPLEKFTGKTAEAVIALAVAGDQVAHQALCIVAARLTNDKETLPLGLQKYVVGAAAKLSIGKRGTRTAYNGLRDDAILDAVELVMKFGFKATRNVGHKPGHESACSIVVEALRNCGAAMSEKNVNEIYANRRKLWERSGVLRS